MTGQINELVRKDHVPRGDFLLQTADCSYRNQVSHSKFFQTPDVGPKGNFGRHQHMSDPMPWKKRHRDPVDSVTKEEEGLPKGVSR